MASAKHFRVGVASVLASFLAVAAGRGEKPSKAEIAKRGKAATALVVNRPVGGTGTAFCIHPSGLFITNEHVVRGRPGAKLQLVLHSGLKEQKILTATVARSDPILDLALLRAEGDHNLPTLTLGSVKNLTELMDLIAFGFPFGLRLAFEKDRYPRMSVNVSRLTALRERNGQLHRLELDGALNPGHSGSPLLDENGHVAGVVVAGLRGGVGITWAIPVSHLEKFLERPEVHFTPPQLTDENVHKEVEFRVQVASALPANRPLRVELALAAEGIPRRVIPMVQKDGSFRVSVVPVPARQGVGQVKVAVRFPDGTVSAHVADRKFSVGGQGVRLAELRWLHPGPQAAAVLRDGRSLQGALTGLGVVEARLGDQALTLDLSRAKTIDVDPPAVIDDVSCTVVVRRGDREIDRLHRIVVVEGLPWHASPRAGRTEVKPPLLEKERVYRKLPSTFTSDVVGGGAGRYLIFHLPNFRRLAVFDVTAARVIKLIPLSRGPVKFTAGLDKLVVALPEKGVLQRWSLESFKRELTVSLPVKNGVQNLVMGSASRGPVVLNDMFLDLQSLKSLVIVASDFWPVKGVNVHPEIRASADGKVFTAWLPRSPDLYSFMLREDRLTGYRGRQTSSYAVPGPDGEFIFGNQVLTNDLKQAAWADWNCGVIPALQGNYFLTLGCPGFPTGIAVCLAGQSRPIAKLPGFEHYLGIRRSDEDRYGSDKRVFFIPEAKVIILIRDNNQLVLHRFDADEALEKSGVNYLFVMSQPPRTAPKGSELIYQMKAKSKKGGVVYKLESGPEGMKVSSSGRLTWHVPTTSKDKEASIVISVSDSSGEETYHTFTLTIPDA
jgi:hypothetical protein